MELVASILMILGGVGLLVCGIILLVRQFQTSILWGLGCLLIPFVSLIWLVMYWDEGKVPFLYSLLFTGVMIGGVAMAPV